MEVGILFNSLPKIAFENSEPDVTLILDFVLVNDVEDHVVILVQFVHGVGVLVKDLNSKNAISPGNTGISRDSISTNCTHVEKFCGQHVNIALNRLAPRESRPFEILEIAHHVMHIPVGERGCSEWGVDVHKLPPSFKCAEGDSAFGRSCFVDDGIQVLGCGLRAHHGGPSLLKALNNGVVHATLLNARQPVGLNRQGPSQQPHLPWMRRPDHQGRFPKLRGQRATQLPAQDPDNEFSPTHLPKGTHCRLKPRGGAFTHLASSYPKNLEVWRRSEGVVQGRFGSDFEAKAPPQGFANEGS